MNKREIYNSFKNSIILEEGKSFVQWVREDKPRARMAFNDYVDAMEKDGMISRFTANRIYLNQFVKCE